MVAVCSALKEELMAQLAEEKSSHLSTRRTLEVLEAKHAETSKSLGDALSRVSTVKGEHIAADRELSELKVRTRVLEECLEQERDKAETTKRTTFEAERSLADLSTEIEKLKSSHSTQLGVLVSEKKLFEDRAAAFESEMARHKEESAALKAQVLASSQQLLAAKSEVEGTEARAKEAEVSASQAHGREMRALQQEVEHLRCSVAEQREEVELLKRQNKELRAKVIRQDAAWKRKIESERRRGHIVDLPSETRTHRSPLAEHNGATSGPREVYDSTSKAWA